MSAENTKQPKTTAPSGAGHRRAEPLGSRRELGIGIDVGSTSSDVVVLDSISRVVFSSYRRTQGRPAETLSSQLKEVFARWGPSNLNFAAATGSAARLLAKLLDVPFVNEVLAQAAAIHHLYPHLQQATVIEMGGQDSKRILLSTEQGRSRVTDFALNTVCAAGTGSFLDQQAQRLGINIEDQFGQLALQSTNVPRIAGRCSVFAKSDMIHLQQQATPTRDIIAGLCLALARNLKGNLGRGKDLSKPLIFTGGVAANIGVVRAMEEVFELNRGELLVPDEHLFTGAIGAVLAAKGKYNLAAGRRLRTDKLDEYLAQPGRALKDAPRRAPLPEPALPPEGAVCEHLLSASSGPIDAYLGVDVGSISTNVAVIDGRKRLLAKVYLMTAGRPLEAVRKGLSMVGEKVVGRVRILGAATTGSGRYLTGDFLGADIVINEITAQAAGTTIVNPGVDTIFEIGGQDSKYISLKDGVVVDFEMNHACAAGTGSFLEEQAQRLGINVNKEFAELAFKSRSPIKLGERCTVFMESDLLSYQQQGAETGELVAGLSYSIVANYLNRVVGRRRIGDNICFQGGTAFNRAVWSAFEQVLGRPVMVPDHHEVTGAIGAASIAAERMTGIRQQNPSAKSSFRGFENLVSISYEVESFTCEHCPNHCEIKKVQLQDAQPLYYGSRCDRYNLNKKTGTTEGLSAFEYRSRKLLEFAGLSGSGPASNAQQGKTKAATAIGIPMALVNWQLLPLFCRFFQSLGLDVVLSGRTDRRIIRMGIESVVAQPCFPVKVAYGHIAELLEKKLDYIFLPSIVSMMADGPSCDHNQLCPYVQSLPYQAKTAFLNRFGRTKILTAPLYLGRGRRLLRKGFLTLARQLGISSVSAVNQAVETGLDAQTGFEQSLRDKGAEILGRLGPDQRIFVLICRPYNGCDDGLNLQLPRKLAELGAEIIPMDMLPLDYPAPDDGHLHSGMYWTYGRKILKAAELIKNDPRLFAIYLSNFSCGPDSFLLTFFKHIMGRKPCLQLELDEHSADTGVITRLEAYLDSLKHYKSVPGRQQPVVKEPPPAALSRRRRLYIPYMSDCSYGMAACFRAYSQPAEVMPLADEAALLAGRQFTTGKECLPCAITSGDILQVVKTDGFDPDRTAFFMPGSCGPCRFGMYSCMHRLILGYVGVPDVPVISPNQDGGFYSELAGSVDSSAVSSFMKDMWTAIVGIDLLQKLLLRIRPFAVVPEEPRQLYSRSLERWLQAVEKRRGLSALRSLMDSIAEDFAAVRLDGTMQKPLIGIVGEIYVRNHPFANSNIIARLEQLGAACDLASLAEWVYYTNFTRRRTAGRARNWRNLFTNTVMDFFQHRIEKTLARPLEKRFGALAEAPIEHIIKLAEPYLHHSFEGEAILSIGKMVEFFNHGVGGVANVMPFSCMPSTVVSTHSMRISAECGDMPILNLSFDGQEDATLTTRLEAFVEQVASRGASSGVHQIMRI